LKTAVVILNWNGKEHLEKYLPYLMDFTNPEEFELIIADNGSSDDSVHFVQETYPLIRIIELDKNYGFAGGYNKALEQVKADIYCLLNSDVRVTKNWTAQVLEIFMKEADVVAVQPKILSDRDWSRFEHAGAAGGFIDKYGYPFCRGRILNAIEYDKGQYNKKTDIFWASGACLFIRSKAFWECGGFDADYFAHMEEIDLCWKLKNRGYRILYCPRSKVYHYGGATLEYNNPRKLYLNFRNSLWTLYKNYTGKCLRCIMIRRMLIDTTAILKFLITFDFRNAGAVIKAHLHYYKSKAELKKKRAGLLQYVEKTRHPELLNSSIVLRFFLRSQKTFKQIKYFHTKLIVHAKANGR
jgi:GT2 family glycosyltransferase